MYAYMCLTTYQHTGGNSERIMVLGARLSLVHLVSAASSSCHWGESIETSVSFSFLVCEVEIMKIKLPQRVYED